VQLFGLAVELLCRSGVVEHPRPFLPPQAGHLTSRPHGRFFFGRAGPGFLCGRQGRGDLERPRQPDRCKKDAVY
jgi:hypothetical protein